MAEAIASASGEDDQALVIGGTSVAPGTATEVEIPVARLPTDTWMSLNVAVAHGAKPGPRVWLTGAVHGDELNGVEIIARVMSRLEPSTLHGSVMAVPIVNVFGFINESRYLPDRRDLNRSFPGGPKGSLASRLADILMSQIVGPCSAGIDLHTGSDHRTNLPQIRANLDDPETDELATAFGTPVKIHASVRDGSLRGAATDAGCKVLLYEGGEANRFDAVAIDAGVRGVLGVLDHLGIRHLTDHDGAERRHHPTRVDSTSWVRARRGGILRLEVTTGDHVTKGQVVGVVADALGHEPSKVRSPLTGIVIGHTRHPLVSQGDALVHVAETDHSVPFPARRRKVATAPFTRQRNR